MALPVLFATAAQARDPVVDDGLLRIASWNLADAEEAGAIERPKRTEKRWRTTFGAELRSRPRSNFAGGRLKADVVLLQGVASIREVRRIFPARDWKLIVSRQILKFGRGRLNVDSELTGKRTTTAIAVRYQRQLRVTGLEHLLDLSDVDEDVREQDANAPASVAAEETAQRAATSEGSNDKVAGIAARLSFSGSVLWVLSAVLPEACRTSGGGCRPVQRLRNWANNKRADGFGVVIGGRLQADIRQPGDASSCAGQEVVADKSLGAEVGADTIAGCVAFADIK
ncbi:MAG: hypothetical protein K0U74_04295 [Alphaproteobacteria bacterium]|nr:hypothetical protein [Alphaproteobacteria bacterium]